MPAAANPMKALDVPAVAPGAVPPADGELFASILAGDVIPVGPGGEGEGEVGCDLPGETEGETAEPIAAFELLLPLIDQQRAALVAPGAPNPTQPGAEGLPLVTAEVGARDKAATEGLAQQPAPRTGAETTAPATTSESPAVTPAVPVPIRGEAATKSEGQVKSPLRPVGGETAAPEAESLATSSPHPLPWSAPSAAAGSSEKSPSASQNANPLSPLIAEGEGEASKPSPLTTILSEFAARPARQKSVRAVETKPAAGNLSTGAPAGAVPITAEAAKSSVGKPTGAVPAVASAAKPAQPDIVAAESPVRAAAVDGAAPLPASPASTGPAAPLAAAPAAAPTLTQALAAQVLNIAADGAWIDELARDIGRMASGSGDLRFRLTPESLGELKVEISQTDRGAVIRMAVSSEAAQAAIADAKPQLLAEARAQGVRIADAQVDLASSQQGKSEHQRQHAAGHDQPLRAFRATHPNQASAGQPSRGPTDRYA